MLIHKFALITPVALAVALAVALLGGCGGGSSTTVAATPDTPPPVVPAFVGVTLTGTAATGAALAGANVEAKCATLVGNTKSATDGSYTLTIEGAALPCLLRATSVDGVTVLHSVADGAGAKAATANITPVTELIIAKAVGGSSTPASAFGANTQFSATQLAGAKAAVIAALKTITDLTGIDPLSTAFKAAAGGVGGDDTDKLLDKLTKALADAKLPLARLSNALVTAADASASLAAVTSVFSTPPVLNCPSLRSGSYAGISRRGDTFESDFNLSTMRATDADGEVRILVAANEACRFNLLDAQGVQRGQVVLGAEGVGLGVTEASAQGDLATTLLLPKQKLTQAALAGNWTAVEWDRYSHSTFPRFGFATVAITADGKASFQGCTQTGGEANCNVADRKGTGTVTINTSGQVTASDGKSTGSVSRGYVFRASNGTYLMAWGKPNGDGITLLTRSAPSTLPTFGATRKVWEAFGTSTTENPGTFLGRPLTAFDVNFTSVNSATTTLTAANGQIITLNKLLPGLAYRAAGSNGSNSWPEGLILDVPGVLSVIGMNEATSSSFGISLLRP